MTAECSRGGHPQFLIAPEVVRILQDLKKTVELLVALKEDSREHFGSA